MESIDKLRESFERLGMSFGKAINSFIGQLLRALIDILVED